MIDTNSLQAQVKILFTDDDQVHITTWAIIARLDEHLFRLQIANFGIASYHDKTLSKGQLLTWCDGLRYMQRSDDMMQSNQIR